jgi:hypothetical protein
MLQADAAAQSPEESLGLAGRMKRFFLGDGMDRKRLAALGTPQTPCCSCCSRPWRDLEEEWGQ